MEDPRIRVTYLKKYEDPTSPIVALLGAHIRSMDFYLSKMKLVKKKNGDLFVAAPAEPYKDKETGQTKYSEFWWFGQSSTKFFQEEMMKAIKAYCEEKNIKGINLPE